VFLGALPIHLFRPFGCRMYHFEHNVTNRRTDGQMTLWCQ